MESPNSGSIQSSSTGDNEYDAVVDSPVPSSSFFNFPPPPPPPPPPLPATTPASSLIFDSFSPYFSPFPFPAPPSEQAATWPLPPPHPPPPVPPLPLLSVSAPSSTRSGPTPPPVQPGAAPRGPKKRTRASRRAPTTMINTETSNFRAMVQQFTGFPSAPFLAAAPPFQSPGLQLDLFGSSAAAVPQFLLRPSAQKIIPSPASSSVSPSLFDHIIARSNLASMGNSSITGTDVDGTSKYHDKFPLSLFEQQPDAAIRDAERGSFMPPAFLQPQRAQMAQLPAKFSGGRLGNLIATGGGATTNISDNNRPRSDVELCWDVNQESREKRRPTSSIEDQQSYQKVWRPNID